MSRRHPLVVCVLIAFSIVIGCTSGKKSSTQFLSLGTAPVGGAFPLVGGAIAEVLNANRGKYDWKVQAKGTKGSQENIRRLQQNELELAMSNAAISYFAARGEASWDKPYDIRAIATLAPNVALFITRADSDIQTIADLKGKRVITGPAGAGFEMFVEPILVEHGVGWDDFTSLNATQSGAVDQLSDGSADAAFLGGAVPSPSITQAASTFDVRFVPFDEQARQSLIEKYPFFHEATIPAKNREGQPTYKGMEEDFAGLNVGSMHLITSASQDEDLIYEITKTIWEKKEDIAAKHPAGRAINENNVTRDTGIPFHPGAIRFYREAGLMSDESAQADSATTDDSAENADAADEGAEDAGSEAEASAS